MQAFVQRIPRCSPSRHLLPEGAREWLKVKANMGGACFFQREASPLSRLASWSSLCVCQCCLKHSLLQWKLLRMSQRPLRHRMHCMRASLSGWHQHT